MRRLTEIYVKLPSVPALVTLTTKTPATQVLLSLIDSGHKAKKISADTVVVEE